MLLTRLEVVTYNFVLGFDIGALALITPSLFFIFIFIYLYIYIYLHLNTYNFYFLSFYF